MTGAQTASFVVLTTAVVLVYLLVVIGVPRLARLLFRHRLDVIRDECVDAILDGRLHEATSVRRFLRTIDTAMAISRELTLPRIFALAQALVDVGIDLSQVIPRGWYADLEADEQKIMVQLDKRLCHAYGTYLDWGSPVSWVRRPFVLLIEQLRPAGDTAKARKAVAVVARETLQPTAARPLPVIPSPRHLFAGR